MIKKTDIVYISGPMSGLPDENKPKFREIEHALQHLYGCIILSPARHPKGLAHSQYMEYAKLDIQNASAVLFIEGHWESAGANIEMLWTLAQNKKIVYEREICKI
jgi:hypothetical protein